MCLAGGLQQLNSLVTMLNLGKKRHFLICAMLQDENHMEIKILLLYLKKKKKKSGYSPSRSCSVTLTSTTSWRSFVPVRSCRLPPPTLSPSVMCQAEQAVRHLLNKA